MNASGTGTAWLVADRSDGTFNCYLYAGPSDDRLDSHARVATAVDAVAWGRARTPRVRIRDVDGRSAWAGTGPRPDGIAHTWSAPC